MLDLKRHEPDPALDQVIGGLVMLGAFFAGAGCSAIVYAFILAGNAMELGTLLAGAAAPCTMAGFMFIAASNYQQHQQLGQLDDQNKTSKRMVKQSKRHALASRQESDCDRNLQAYIGIRDSIDLLRPNHEIVGNAQVRGVAGFAELRHRLDPTRAPGGRQIDWRPYEDRLTVFADAIRFYTEGVDSMTDVDRRAVYRRRLKVYLTPDEVWVISEFQKSLGDKELRCWLAADNPGQAGSIAPAHAMPPSTELKPLGQAPLVKQAQDA